MVARFWISDVPADFHALRKLESPISGDVEDLDQQIKNLDLRAPTVATELNAFHTVAKCFGTDQPPPSGFLHIIVGRPNGPGAYHPINEIFSVDGLVEYIPHALLHQTPFTSLWNLRP